MVDRPYPLLCDGGIYQSRHGNVPGYLNIIKHRREKLLSTKHADDGMVMSEVALKVVGISAYD